MEMPIRGRGRSLAEAAGWVAWRHVDISVYVGEMEAVGFEVPDSARQFLEAFWGIRIEHPPSVNINGRVVFCHTDFNSMRVCTERDADTARRCAAVVGTPLFPVGVDSFHLTIYFSPAGEVFAGMDSSVFRFAEGVDEFFGKLADGSRPQHAGDWEI